MAIAQKAIAVIDDDPAMLKAIARLLKALGFDTETFASAEAFLNRNAASEVACLVVDVNLGGISGIELKRRLTASGSQLPVIFITAMDDQSLHSEAMNAGCAAYLRKPFSALQLVGAINRATD